MLYLWVDLSPKNCDLEIHPLVLVTTFNMQLILHARWFVEWGMSEKLGTVNYNSANDQVFVGRDMGHASNKVLF